MSLTFARPVTPRPTHVDPVDVQVARPDRSRWSELQQAAWTSSEMEAFRAALCMRGLPDVRSGVLDDLSSYFKLDAEQCIYQATHSFELSAGEWLAKPERSREEDITDFYLHTRSWLFGLLWYAYLQAEGFAYPVSVIIAQDLRGRKPGALLDFGSGTGVTAQLFAALGYRVSLADISTPLLDFARYRLERRGTPARYVDLNHDLLEQDAYTVVTAIQTLGHVPNLARTAGELHAALTPEGLLYADVDARPRTPGVTLLYEDDLPCRAMIRRSGFVQQRNLDGATIRYRRTEPSGLVHALRALCDRVTLGGARRTWRRLRYSVR